MDQIFNILIVEDELLIAEMIKEILISFKYNVVSIVRNYDNAIEILKKNSSINLILLDINLTNSKNGIEIAEIINKVYNIPFIYITSHSEISTINKEISTNPEGFIIKPFTESDIYSTLEIVKSKIENKYNYLTIKDGYKKVKIQIKDIFYLKSDNNYIELTTINKHYIIRNSLDKFLKENPFCSLIRVHRSFVINKDHIESSTANTITINSTPIPISRKFKEDIKKLI